MFGYLAGLRGAGSSLLGAGCNLGGAGHGLRGAGHGLRCAGREMLSLILEIQTCQLGLFCSPCNDSLTKKCFSHVLFCYTSRTNPHSTPTPAPRKLCPAACKLHSIK